MQTHTHAHARTHAHTHRPTHSAGPDLEHKVGRGLQVGRGARLLDGLRHQLVARLFKVDAREEVADDALQVRCAHSKAATVSGARRMER